MSTTQTKMTSTYQLNALDVSYKNNETFPATVWAAKFSYIYADDVKTPTFG